MANLDSKYPVSKCCPQCGSTEYSRQKTEATIAFASDRVCKSCQTRYTPPTPVWAAIVFIGIGFLLILVGTIFAPLAISSFFFKHDPLASLGQSLRLIAIASVGILCLVFGVKALRRNREAAGALSGFVLISGIACGGAWSSNVSAQQVAEMSPSCPPVLGGDADVERFFGMTHFPEVPGTPSDALHPGAIDFGPNGPKIRLPRMPPGFGGSGLDVAPFPRIPHYGGSLADGPLPGDTGIRRSGGAAWGIGHERIPGIPDDDTRDPTGMIRDPTGMMMRPESLGAIELSPSSAEAICSMSIPQAPPPSKIGDSPSPPEVFLSFLSQSVPWTTLLLLLGGLQLALKEPRTTRTNENPSGRVNESVSRRANETPSQRAKEHWKRGEELRRLGRDDEAIAQFTEAIRLHSEFADAYLSRGLAYSQIRDSDRSLADFTEAIRLDPKGASGWFHRGILHARSGELDEAINDLGEATQRNPAAADAWFHRGHVLARKGSHWIAIIDFTRAIQLKPDDALALHFRGVSYATIGETDKAIADQTRVISLDPLVSAAYCKRGTLHAAKREFMTAIADFTEAIRLNPRDEEAYYGRAYIHKEMGDVAEAEADLARARNVGP